MTSSFHCFDAGPAPCNGPKSATNIDAEDEHSTYTGTRSRGNLTWHITPDLMVYYTFSQGFRPGLFNRSGGCHVNYLNTGIPQYCIPLKIAPDSLTNNEVGWKTEFFDHRIQFNGARLPGEVDQRAGRVLRPGPVGQPHLRDERPELPGPWHRGAVGGTRKSGPDGDRGGVVQQERTNKLAGADRQQPGAADESAQRGSVRPAIAGLGNPFGAVGSPTANSPLFQGNIRARYEWAFNEYNMFAQVGATYSSSSFTQTGNNPSLSAGSAINTTLLRFENPSYGLVDAALGIAKDQWTAQLFGENLADRNVSLFTSTGQFVVTQTPTRPRVLGLQIGYKF